MSELLLELFSEEIPALLQEPAAEAYQKIFVNFLTQNNIKYDSVKTFCGPRRITLCAQGLPTHLEATTTEIKGPKAGAPENAIEGFCQSNKITKDQLIITKIKDAEYYLFIQENKAREIAALLQESLSELIGAYTWPKSMYWGESKFKWIRPLRNILCLFDGQVIKFHYGHLSSNNQTYGRRFINNSNTGPILKVENFADYQQKLYDNFVILDHNERAKIIETQIDKIVNNNNLKAVVSDKLLQEVTGLVEWPNAMIGRIEEKFLELPVEVLVSSMETNQKYFCLIQNEKRMSSSFIFIADGEFTAPELVINGNQKVLYARLSDALYFYEQDLKKPIAQQLESLKQVIFHAKLGNLYEKSLRLQKIVQFLAPLNQELTKAALLCKTDITSEMVGEFPNLQGVVGYYYALARGESEHFAHIIKDHYKPQGIKDECPSSDAALLALADKIDNLTGLILAGEEPTGSKDPFALRRQALGMIRIILDNNLSIDVAKLIEYSLSLYSSDITLIKQKILGFFEERVKHYLKEQYPQNIILSVLDFSKQSDLLTIISKINCLSSVFSNETNNAFIAIYRRMNNILGNEAINLSINEALFQHESEQLLYNFLQKNISILEQATKQENYNLICKILLSAEAPLSNFFDNVMVKAEDLPTANNRLALLKNIKNLFDQFADFSKL